MTSRAHQPESHDQPTRTQMWAATMAGNADHGVVRAHREPLEYIGFDGASSSLSHQPLLDAPARCDAERSLYSPSATFSSLTGNRSRLEVAKDRHDLLGALDFRTNFEHDRDRILHCCAFRRLAGKTQVYLNPDDHQRTRLTHALEVAQIAKAIARALRLNETLAEAIALGHDCGHGPGGHASEDAFDIYLEGGFHHAQFGADVTLRRLNLCSETLDGIRNHSWSLNTPVTLEAEVVSFADRIAYVCHDMEDALSCGLISANDYPSHLASFLAMSRGEQIDYFIRGVIAGTLQSSTLAITRECGEMLKEYRQFNHDVIYQHPLSQKQNEIVITTLRQLVDYYLEHYCELPIQYRQGLSDDDKSRTFGVVEYVAGMTDQYAYDKHTLYIGS